MFVAGSLTLRRGLPSQGTQNIRSPVGTQRKIFAGLCENPACGRQVCDTLRNNFLHRIHKILFRLVKNDEAEKHQYYGKHRSVTQCLPAEAALPQKGKAEGFHNAGHRIKLNNPFVFIRYGRKRINNRCCIHQQLDSELYQKGEVAVFGSQGRYDHSEAKSHKSH